MNKMLDPKVARAAAEVVVDLGDGALVRCRKEDMTTLVFDGRVPMPILAAVERMIKLPTVSSDADRIAALGTDNGRDIVKIMREHAVAVILEPRFSMEFTSDESVVPITYLTVPQLVKVWNATAMVPKVTQSQAGKFRRRTGGRAADALPVGPDVPAAPKPMVVAEVEVISG